MPFSKKVFILNFFAIFLFVLDRAAKWLILKETSYQRSFLFFKIEFHKNAGLFGFEINKYLLLAASFFIITILIFFLIQNYKKKNFFLILILTLILTGALSNLADRLIYNGVIDFINFFSLSIFNFADCLIISGIILWTIKEIPKISSKD